MFDRTRNENSKLLHDIMKEITQNNIRNTFNLKSLPGSLGEALEELKKSTLVKSALGEHVYEHFLIAKTQEWNEYRTYVSAWELDRYLAIM